MNLDTLSRGLDPALSATLDAVKSRFETVAAAINPFSPLVNTLARYFADASRQVLAANNALLRLPAAVSGSLIPAILAPVAPLQQLATQLTPFVSAFSPVTVQQFQLALQDTYAVLGQGLTPAFEEITETIRKFGDMLLNSDVPQRLGEILGTLVKAIEPVIEAVFGLMKALMPIVQFIVDLLAPAFKVLAGALDVITEVIKFFRQVVYNVLREIMNLIPDGKESWEKRDFAAEEAVEQSARDKEKKSSVGMAVRNVSINDGAGALDAFRRRVSEMSLKVGSGPDKVEQQILLARQQVDVLKEMRNGQGKLTEAMENLFDRKTLEAQGVGEDQISERTRERARARREFAEVDDTGLEKLAITNPLARVEMEARRDRKAADPNWQAPANVNPTGVGTDIMIRVLEDIARGSKLNRV